MRGQTWQRANLAQAEEAGGGGGQGKGSLPALTSESKALFHGELKPCRVLVAMPLQGAPRSSTRQN